MKSLVSRLAILLILSLAAFNSSHAQTFTLLHAFPSTPTDGIIPWAPLTFDAAGNLYGTTEYSAPSIGNGTLFRLDSSGHETVLHRFSGIDDAANPLGPMVRVGGTIYGTTVIGPGGKCTSEGGCGALYSWSKGQLTILHNFTKAEPNPPQGLASDSQGNLYGAGTFGGADLTGCKGHSCGGIFQYSEGTVTILHSFTGQPDGAEPNGELLVDRSGNIFGTTQTGGAFNHGAIFELSPNGGGAWIESILYSFRGMADGALPAGGVIMDAKGNLYGTTSRGGIYQGGVVYKMAQKTDGSWNELLIYRFAGTDGANPVGNLLRDKQGNLYGVTSAGGTAVGGWGPVGTVFEIENDGTEKLLKSFTSLDEDGGQPQFGLTMDSLGNLYGTTVTLGQPTGHKLCSLGCGTVFKITP